ncbi:DUF6710 family protein [Bifidobacterium callitrichos]|uniref:DUF6710 family protein n=1 Tax=Bifidobacterium callitrichos TaxID=762209 RepID=UPI0011B29145|nr:DUF6710 family protein [Bifidobacterium callitrichos]
MDSLVDRLTELEQEIIILRKERREFERIEKDNSIVPQYTKVGRLLADDERFAEYETHPLMRLISITTRSWCDRLLMKDDRLVPFVSKSEVNLYSDNNNMPPRYRASDSYNRLYGISSGSLLPPKQNKSFNHDIFCEFNTKEYDQLLTCQQIPLSSMPNNKASLGIDPVYCSPWDYNILCDKLEKNDPSHSNDQWQPYINSKYIMDLPFCLVKLDDVGNHATAAGVLLNKGSVEIEELVNYSLSALFDKVSSDGCTWNYDEKPYCYVYNPVVAQIWELCRAVHNASYPIKYRGVVLNQLYNGNSK